MNGKFSVRYFFLPGLCFSILACGAMAAPVKHTQHDPAMWEKDIHKFESMDRKHMPPTGGVLFIGSSSIRIWKAQKAFPDQNVINRGFGGSWSCDSAYYANRIAIPYKPRTIIFYAGDNDIDGGASPAEVVNSFKDFVAKVRAKLPKTQIVFISIKPSIARWRLFGQMQKANAMVRNFAKNTAGVVYLNVGPEMLGPDGKPRADIFRKDGLHMNAKGYAIWNQKVKPYVDSK